MYQAEYESPGSAVGNAKLRSVGRNVAAGLLLFALFAGLDWLTIDWEVSVEVDLLLITLGPMTYALVPFVFWLANRTAFSHSSRPRTYRILLALGMGTVWWALALPLLILVHIALGGRL